jgi:hypothetical protein
VTALSERAARGPLNADVRHRDELVDRLAASRVSIPSQCLLA